MNAFRSIFLRELRAYFLSPLAYVFLAVYILVTGLSTWNMARFFDTALADLTPFFQFQPWLLAFFIPAIGMRLWSEDLKSGTVDLYLTAPAPIYTIHLAKFAAGLMLVITALSLTLPYWGIVTYLGTPDHGAILGLYLNLIVTGIIFLLITLAFSALTQQQVIAFVLSTFACLAFLVIGLPAVTSPLSAALPGWIANWLLDLSLYDVFARALRGIILLSDVVYLVGLVLLLFFAGLVILSAKRRVGSRTGLPFNTLSLALLFVALPLLRGGIGHIAPAAQIDMTADRLNTLSPSAKQLAAELKEPIDLVFFYSETIGQDYPQIRAHAERVEATLNAFQRASNGQLRVRTIDPEPYSAGEDLAITHGMTEVPTEGIDPLYFGISGQNRTDDLQSIPFLNPERDDALEFDIASLISTLDQITKPKIAILSGSSAISENGGDGTASHISQKLIEGFEIVWLSPTSLEIPEDVETVLLIAPPDLSDYTAYQLDQFLMRKGRLILMMDPAPLFSQTPPLGPKLSKWLSDWGIKPSDAILADTELGLPVTTNGPAGQRVETQPIYLGPGPSQFDRSDFLTRSLKQKLHIGGTGWFDVNGANRLQASPLIQSSLQSYAVQPADLASSDLTPSSVRALMTPLERSVPIALRLSGRLTSRYSDGAPEPDLPEDPVLKRIAEASLVTRPHLQKSDETVQILLFGDIDFLSDAFYVHPQTGALLADNEALILNALDQFAGRSALAGLRARPSGRRPMTRVLELRQTAEANYLAEQDALEQRMSEIQTGISQAAPETRQEYLEAREALRNLQRQFRSQINRLETTLRILTIWLPFTLAILTGLLIHFTMQRRT